MPTESSLVSSPLANYSQSLPLALSQNLEPLSLTHHASNSYAHPLDPLSSTEISEAVQVVSTSKSLASDAFFPTVTLKDPDKAAVLNYTSGVTPPREALVVVLEQAQNLIYEGVVNLDTDTVTTWRVVSEGQPAILESDFELLSSVVKADARWQAAMARRGVTDLDQVQVDGWAPGLLSDAEEASGARLIRGLSYFGGDDPSSFYNRPIEGVLVTVNLNTGEIVDFFDSGVISPISNDSTNLDPSANESNRPMLAPLEIEQPNGQGFSIHGNQITWDNWSFHYRMDPRAGLVVNLVNYNDNGQERSILYDGRLSEMAVPYADTDTTWQFRNAFDVGEYGLGRLSNSMVLGREVPTNAVLIDSVFADDFGAPYISEDSLGVYERDSGLIWQHYDYVTDTTQGRRGRELVLTYIVTIGNYDYALDWVFGQDGSIKVEAQLTGQLLLKGTPATTSDELSERDAYGTLVAPNLIAPNHQHFFNFRLDMDIDGVQNAAIEENTKSDPTGLNNPTGNAFRATETLLTSELKAQRDWDYLQNRAWEFVNSDHTNALGGDIGYTLEVEGNALPFASYNSDIRQRAGFINHHLWVTQYNPNELWAAGDYPNQGRVNQGLPKYTADDQSIVDTDIVTWYTLGTTHIPHPEEYPVMPVEQVGFKLKPSGFFTRNPALDVRSIEPV